MLQTYSEDAWDICTGVQFYVVIINSSLLGSRYIAVYRSTIKKPVLASLLASFCQADGNTLPTGWQHFANKLAKDHKALLNLRHMQHSGMNQFISQRKEILRQAQDDRTK